MPRPKKTEVEPAKGGAENDKGQEQEQTQETAAASEQPEPLDYYFPNPR